MANLEHLKDALGPAHWIQQVEFDIRHVRDDGGYLNLCHDGVIIRSVDPTYWYNMTNHDGFVFLREVYAPFISASKPSTRVGKTVVLPASYGTW